MSVNLIVQYVFENVIIAVSYETEMEHVHVISEDDANSVLIV